MAKKQYTWFLRPLDNHTNEVICKTLGEYAEENFLRTITLSDGKRYYLWECPVQLVADFYRSQYDMGLRFIIYNRFGNSKIRRCPRFIWQPRWRKFSPPKSVQKQIVPQ